MQLSLIIMALFDCYLLYFLTFFVLYFKMFWLLKDLPAKGQKTNKYHLEIQSTVRNIVFYCSFTTLAFHSLPHLNSLWQRSYYHNCTRFYGNKGAGLNLLCLTLKTVLIVMMQDKKQLLAFWAWIWLLTAHLELCSSLFSKHTHTHTSSQDEW